MTSSPILIAAAALMMLSFATALASQPVSSVDPDRGVPARTVWDGVYTEAQASRGRASYQASCARCHPSDTESGLPDRRFVGDRFWAAWGEDSLDGLHAFLKGAMPNDAPGTLGDQLYVDVTAYLLQANEAPAGPTELTDTTVGSVRLARRDSAGEMPAGAFVAVVGCLARNADGTWTITQATAPVRSRTADAKADAARAAEQPPGSGVFGLLYVITPLAKMAGHQVLVRGQLVREPADAINVTRVQSLAESCPP